MGVAVAVAAAAAADGRRTATFVAANLAATSCYSRKQKSDEHKGYTGTVEYSRFV